jgi:hypothetical protein
MRPSAGRAGPAAHRRRRASCSDREAEIAGMTQDRSAGTPAAGGRACTLRPPVVEIEAVTESRRVLQQELVGLVSEDAEAPSCTRRSGRGPRRPAPRRRRASRARAGVPATSRPAERATNMKARRRPSPCGTRPPPRARARGARGAPAEPLQDDEPHEKMDDFGDVPDRADRRVVPMDRAEASGPQFAARRDANALLARGARGRRSPLPAATTRLDQASGSSSRHST